MAATELRQDLVSESFEHVGEIADFLFADFRIFYVRKNAEDEVFVLDVAGCYELLETFPVFGSELFGEFAEFSDLVFFELAFEIRSC